MLQPIIYPCPRCATPYTLTPDYLAQYGGQTTVCKNCGGQFVLPGAAAASGQIPAAHVSMPAPGLGQGMQGQPTPGQPQQVLPYAGPQWGVQMTPGAWSEGPLVIVTKDTS